MSERLHIVLPVHNRREVTVAFVEALRQQTRREFRLVLIDDGSTDGTADAVRALWPEVDVVTGTGDWWWAGSLAHGCERIARTGVTDDDVLLLINDDVVIGADFLQQGLSELAQTSDTLLLARQVDAVTGKAVDHGGGVKADLVHLRFAAARTPEEINCLPTRGLFLRWRDFRRTGGFRPERLPHYLSDYEFTLRAQCRGLKLRVAREATVGIQLGRTGRSLANLFDAGRTERFRLLFSPRYKDNPITWSAFVRLAVPPGRRPFLWLKIWLNFLRTVARCIYQPVAHDASH
jgi:GT2 family glycosyltransferase